MTETNSTKTTKKTLTSKLADLDEKVNWFYSEDFSLEKAVENYRSAVTLAKDIEQDLQNLKNEIEVISKDFSHE